MKKATILLPLLLCCCAPVTQRPGSGSAARPVAGVATMLASYNADIGAGSIAIDRYGDIYITDRPRQRMVSFKYPAPASADSAVVRFELPLEDPGSFLVPGYQGGFCLAENIGHQLAFYSAQGQRTGGVSIAGHNATAAALDAAGDSYVLDATGRSVLVYDPRGVLVRQFALAREPAVPRFAPSMLAVTRAADLTIIADPVSGLAQQYGPFGGYVGSFTLAAVSLAFDQSDRLWSVDAAGRIAVQARRGRQWQVVWQDQLSLAGSTGVVTCGFGEAVLIAAGGKLISCR